MSSVCHRENIYLNSVPKKWPPNQDQDHSGWWTSPQVIPAVLNGDGCEGATASLLGLHALEVFLKDPVPLSVEKLETSLSWGQPCLSRTPYLLITIPVNVGMCGLEGRPYSLRAGDK